jgi:hypothetical protein
VTYRQLVRLSAGYDLVVTAAFVTPWTYELARRALSALGLALGLGVMPATDPTATTYANLMGSIVIVWAVLRLIDPHPVLGLYDGVARILFAGWEAYGATHGATGLPWGFFAVELVFGVAQLAPWLSAQPPWPTRSFTTRLRRSNRGSTP